MNDTSYMAVKYIEDPKTKVYISINDKRTEWKYAIYVYGTEFLLDLFQTEKEALKFIRDNKLTKVS